MPMRFAPVDVESGDDDRTPTKMQLKQAAVVASTLVLVGLGAFVALLSNRPTTVQEVARMGVSIGDMSSLMESLEECTMSAESPGWARDVETVLLDGTKKFATDSFDECKQTCLKTQECKFVMFKDGNTFDCRMKGEPATKENIDPTKKNYVYSEKQCKPKKYIVNAKGETSCPTDYTFILDENTCNEASEEKFGKKGVEVVQRTSGFRGCHVYNMGNSHVAAFNAGNLDGKVKTDPSNSAYLCVKQ